MRHFRRHADALAQRRMRVDGLAVVDIVGTHLDGEGDIAFHVAWVGLTEDQAKAQGIQVKKGLFPWAASGRAIVGTHAGDMIGEIALAIEMGADSVDIGKTIHPHPTLGESIGMAAEVAHGSCTDVPPQRK